MRVLLVQPDRNRTMSFQQMAMAEPLGLEMIAGALWSRHEVALLDLRLEPDDLDTTLAAFEPHLVGISAIFTIDFNRALDIASAAKAANPRSFVFVGGHHPSLCPEDFYHPAVDAIVVGEGEFTASELVDSVAAEGDLGCVPGLVLNQSQGQHFTGQRPLLKDLDALPYPARELSRAWRQDYHLVVNRPVASLETARGCPHRCRFCSVWPFYRGRVRYKSPQRVVRELETIEEPHVGFTDDSFLTDANRASEIARLIRERRIQKRYTIQARSDDIVHHPEVVAQWGGVGLDAVLIGFEKPDQNSLKAVNKHNSVKNNEKALAILRSLDIEPVASFIADPSYGHEDFDALRAYVRRLKLRLPFFTVLTPFPGTPLFADMKDCLTTANYDLFDVAHAVTPTQLQPEQFYQEFAKLWRQAYPYRRLQFIRLGVSLRDMLLHRDGTSSLQRALSAFYHHGQAHVYLQNLDQAPGSASTEVQ